MGEPVGDPVGVLGGVREGVGVPLGEAPGDRLGEGVGEGEALAHSRRRATWLLGSQKDSTPVTGDTATPLGELRIGMAPSA